MSHLKTICIIGGDMRQVNMAMYLSTLNMNITSYCLDKKAPQNVYNKLNPCSSLKEAVESSNILVLPIPVTKNNSQIFSSDSYNDLYLDTFYNSINSNHIIFGGKIPITLEKQCFELDIPLYDFMQNDTIKTLNAIPTAEGAIMKAISSSTISLHSSNCLILGFGKCGKCIASILKAFNANITISARSEKDLINAYVSGYNTLSLIDFMSFSLDTSNLNKNDLTSNINYYNYNFHSNATLDLASYDFIFNTIPCCILDASILNNLSKDVTIIDIASLPGGVDYSYAKQINLNVEHFLGIPGIVSPKTAGLILSKFILKHI